MRRCLSWPGLGLLVMMMIGPAAVGLGGQEIRVSEEAGTTILHNPKEPGPIDGVSVKLTLRHDLTIGRESGDPNNVFGGLQLFVVDELERVYVLDWKDTKVKVFDAKGQHLLSFGTRGQGPREMNRPTRLIDLPGGGVAVLDSGSKVIYFSPDGEVLKEVPLRTYPGMRRFVISPEGFIYANITSYDEKSILENVIKFSPDLEPLATFASSERKLERRVFNPFSREFLVKMLADGKVAWADPTQYDVRIADASGRVLKRIVKDYDRVKVSNADRNEYIRAAFGDRPVPADVKIDIPKYYPPIQYIVGGGDGRLYVRTYEYRDGEDGRADRYDVFDAQGRYLTKFFHTQTETIVWVLNGKLFSRVEESAGGSEKVNIYSLIWD